MRLRSPLSPPNVEARRLFFLLALLEYGMAATRAAAASGGGGVGGETHGYALDANSVCRRKKSGDGVGGAASASELCRSQPELASEVAAGASRGLDECQHQFRERQWNCTTTHRSFSKVLKTDTRESAFIGAISSAGVLHTVTKACSQGKLWQCHCDRDMQKETPTDGRWEWGGCSDNVAFGYENSKLFMDAKRVQYDIKALIALHNNEAGRLAVMKNVRRECKCHGLSASCALETCWRKMPNFRDVGKLLVDRYDGAAKVIGSNDGYSLMPESEDIKPPGKEDLVYAEESPDFCVPNRKFGTPGTKGRHCNPHSMGPDGCDILCCLRGFDRVAYTVRENCRCRFEWCCEVVCQTCIMEKVIHVCK